MADRTLAEIDAALAQIQASLDSPTDRAAYGDKSIGYRDPKSLREQKADLLAERSRAAGTVKRRAVRIYDDGKGL